MFSLNDVAFLGSLTPAGAYDPDAQSYITAVEAADTQALEVGVKDAINAFVVGCKADGIWSAIKASCILAGARTLTGALVPLVGAAPTNVSNLFAQGDYNRRAGLTGSKSPAKYLNSNRAGNADPQNSNHTSVYITAVTTAPASTFPYYIGSGGNVSGANSIGRNPTNATAIFRCQNNNADSLGTGAATGFYGVNRNVSADYIARQASTNTTLARVSQAPTGGNTLVFTLNDGSSTALRAINGTIAFYSIGESLDLELLDARVTTLINAFAAAIAFDFLDPANIGQPVGGGYFGGLISHTADGNPTHALIVAPAATGATGTGYTLTTDLAWKTSDTATTGANSLFDGAANTAAMVAAGIANHPAAQFCTGLTIDGFNDWYFPSQLEKDIVYFNLKPTTTSNATGTGTNAYAVPPRTANYTAGNPVQTAVAAFRTGGAEAFAAAVHWASNEVTAANARRLTYGSGAISAAAKSTLNPVRAFRRIAL
jgi:hypothetical protein